MKLYEIAFAPRPPQPQESDITDVAVEQDPADADTDGEVDKTDVLTCDVPLFIRLLEWAKESAEDDVALHMMVARAIQLKKPLSMDDYSQLVGDDEDTNVDDDNV